MGNLRASASTNPRGSNPETWRGVLGRSLPAVETSNGVRAVNGTKAIEPEGVSSYLESKFGEDLAETRAAMMALAKRFKPEELRREAFRLYEQFRPQIPEGLRGCGIKTKF